MKLLFVHDGPAFLSDGGDYYEFSYHGLLERYSYLADEIEFLMRVEPLPENASLTPIPNEIEVVAVPNFKSPSSYFRCIKKAKEIIKEEVRSADIVVLRGSSCAHIARVYTKKFNKPCIYECVGCFWDSLWNYSLLGKFMAPFEFLGARRAIRNSRYVYYVTEQFLQRRYPTRGRQVACSNVQIEEPARIVLEKRLEKIAGMNGRVTLGTAAAVDVRYKGQEYVIGAIPGLLNKGYDIEYVLAGSNAHNDNYLEELASRLGVSDRVHFLGSLNKTEMAEFYDSIDIYVQPSKQEGLPRSVIEAMSRACPVVGTSIAGIPELIEAEWLFKKGSSKEVEKTVSAILSSDLSAIAARNYQESKKYSIEKLTKRREAFYDLFLQEYFCDSVRNEDKDE